MDLRLSQLEIDTIQTSRKTFERTTDLKGLDLGVKQSSKDRSKPTGHQSTLFKEMHRSSVNVSESKPALKEILSNADRDLIH